MGEQVPVCSINEVVERVEETVSRLNQMESRISNLEESVKKAVGTLMPKVEALLSARSGEDAPTWNAAGPSTNPVPSSSSLSSLLEVAERGDSEAIFGILAEEQTSTRNILLRTDDGDTALHVAASRGHLKAAVVLLGFGMKVDALGHRLRTPLHCATANAHLLVVQRLLDMGAEVDAKDASGSTALDLAIEGNNTEMVAMLLQRSVRFNNESVFKIASQGHCNIVELLLLNGVSADLCNEEGEFLLVEAARAGRWNMVELLLKGGASVTKCKRANESALRYAAEGGQADTVRLLLRRGAASESEQVTEGLRNAKSAAVVWACVDVVPEAVRGAAGRWGLLRAGCKGRLEPLVALLDAGVDIDARDSVDQSALYLAAWNGHVACVKEMLRRGADVTAKDNNGDTPLHRASFHENVECVRALLAAGASTTERNNAGKTPLEVAATDAVRQLFNAAQE